MRIGTCLRPSGTKFKRALRAIEFPNYNRGTQTHTDKEKLPVN